MPDLVWFPARGLYRAPNGRFLSRTTVRNALEESLVNLQRKTDGLADDLRAGRVSLDDWSSEMRQIIKQTQMAAAEVAHGGRASMTQSDYGRVGQRVRVQYQYLDNWVQQIKSGAPLDNRIEGRAAMYLRGGRAAFLEAEREQVQRQGFTRVRNVLHAAESCAECIAERDRGLVPIQSMSLPGTRTCLGNCRCVLVYSTAA